MAVYLEWFLKFYPNSKYLFTEDDSEKAPARLKTVYGKCLRDNVWRTPDFMDLAP